MFTPKAAGIAAAPSGSVTKEPANEIGSSSGWDPVEVWRTRVLLPRLEQRALAARQTDGGSNSKVVSLRSGS
jgi:hypothetical protein